MDYIDQTDSCLRRNDKIKYMQKALAFAEKGRLRVSPNPMVGCVIVKNNQIIGTGYHKAFGKSHAEINALTQAKSKTKDAEMFVTLEPCCYHGKTPPCTQAIIQAGIKKVFVAMLDPNPLVRGKGIQELQKAGIEVEVGLFEKEAQKLNEKFIYFMQNKKPFVALKMATTLDGKITRQDGKQQITNKKVQQKVHKLRSEYDAILVGKNTILQDNPRLTSYLIKKGKNPLRIILDSNGELKAKNYHIFEDDNFLIIENSKSKVQNSLINLNQLLTKLGKIGISSLLVEGGSQIFTNFLNQNLVQKIYQFQAPILNGTKGLEVVGDLFEIKKLKNISYESFGNNVLFKGYM